MQLSYFDVGTLLSTAIIWLCCLFGLTMWHQFVGTLQSLSQEIGYIKLFFEKFWCQFLSLKVYYHLEEQTGWWFTLFAVISNGLSKQLCVGKFQQLSRIAWIAELDLSASEAKDAGSSNSNWETLKRDHEVYSSLLQAIESSKSCRNDCIGYAVSASSTDNYPDESIVNTLIPMDKYLNRPSYWSSTGHSDPNAPETLIYKLKADLCVITEVFMQPFEGD